MFAEFLLELPGPRCSQSVPTQGTMKIGDVLMLFAVLLSPLLAVQVQKWLELFREKRKRKIVVFETLMATRSFGARLSAEHVRALNMIDLVFYGGNIWGRKTRSKQEQIVLDAWKEYLDQLNTPAGTEQAAVERWATQRDELFINLLHTMSQDVGFSFDRVQLKRGVYSPQAHGTLDAELNAIRTSALGVLSWQKSLSVQLVNPETPPPES
jgi:hypothetical protein